MREHSRKLAWKRPSNGADGEMGVGPESEAETQKIPWTTVDFVPRTLEEAVNGTTEGM